MAHPAVITAIRERTAAGFSGCTIYEENSFKETPSDGKPFIVIQFPYSTAQWLSAGQFQEEGAAVFALHLRLGSGGAKGRQWLEEIAVLFRGQEFDDVQCFAPDTPVADDRNDVPGRYRLTMAVPYLFTIEG